MLLSIKNILDYKKDFYYSNYKNRIGIFPLTSKELSYKNTEDDDIFISTIMFSGKKAEELLNFNYKIPSVIKKKIVNEVFYNELRKFDFLGKEESKELKGKLFTHKIEHNDKVILEIKDLFFNHSLVDKDILSFFIKKGDYKNKDAFFINNVSSWFSVKSANIVYDMWVMPFLVDYYKYDKNILSSNSFVPRIIKKFIDSKITTPIEIMSNAFLNKESISFGITTFFMYKDTILQNSEFKIEYLDKMVDYINETKTKNCLFESNNIRHKEGLYIILEEINELRELDNEKNRLFLLNKLKNNLVNDSIEKNDIKEVVKFFENNELNKEVNIIVGVLNDFKNEDLTKEDEKYINEIPVFINQLVIQNIELKELELKNYNINKLIDEIVEIKLVLIEKYERLIINKIELLKSNGKMLVKNHNILD